MGSGPQIGHLGMIRMMILMMMVMLLLLMMIDHWMMEVGPNFPEELQDHLHRAQTEGLCLEGRCSASPTA